jgi:transcriptional regulator with XRE-family HTH domain
MTIATLITERMNEKEIKASELSQTLGVHPQTIIWWKTGKRHPRAQYITQLAHALDISVESLLDANVNPSVN